ncbi:MAG: hypothetical protein HY704_00170 [Gemmatimonadetes bacterium]|nr:hypothetical protein [Gemmatimonadota bacterium]
MSTMSQRPTRLGMRLGLGAALAALSLSACEGENAFAPRVVTPPKIIALSAPAEVLAGQKIDVRVYAVGEVRIQTVILRFRRAFESEIEQAVTPSSQTAVVDIATTVPKAIADTLLIVSAVAKDALGNLSAAVSDTVRVIDTTPPSVTVTLTEAEVGLGKQAAIKVAATDNVGLRSLGYLLLSATGDTLNYELVQVTGSQRERTFFYDVPGNLTPQELTVQAFAIDVMGNVAVQRASPGLRVIFIDDVKPTITFQKPAAGAVQPVGDSLLVQLRVKDNGAVASVIFEGVAHRGSRALGTDMVVARFDRISATLVPASGDTVVQRYLRPTLDSTAERVYLRATATDGQGNRTVDSLAIQMVRDDGPPTVDIVAPPSGSGSPIGDSLLVRVQLRDTSRIVRATITGVSFRGDRTLGTDTIVERFLSKTVDFNPPVADTVLQRYIFATADTTPEFASIAVIAVDTWGNVGADTVQVVLGGPKVILVNVESGQVVQAGQPLSIRVRASDPQRLVSVTLKATGAVNATLIRSFSSPPDTVTVDTTLAIPDTAEGEFTLVASAKNTLDVLGESESVKLRVVTPFEKDTIPPLLAVTVQAAARLEFTDSVRIEITGRDDNQGKGVATVGYTVLGISPTRGDTLVQTNQVDFSPARTGTVIRNFSFVPFNVDSLSLPDTLVYEVTAFLVDGDGNCSASAQKGQLGRVPCDSLPTGETVGKSVAGQRVTLAVVSGRTVRLPGASVIADAVVDTTRRILILSSIDRDQLEVFNLSTELFESQILVGSRPWGMDFRADTLLVGNSGGTNISYVDLGLRRELVNKRLLTPNIVLFEIDAKVSETGTVKYTTSLIDFSDRPQFLAVDSTGAVIYSTKPTASATLGTIRSARDSTGWEQPEARLFYEHASVQASPTTTSIARIDRVLILSGGGTADDRVDLFDHRNGFPDSTFSTGFIALDSAILNLGGQGSDIDARSGKFNVEDIGLSDTTFVSASGDRGWVVFGEGATPPTGRIILYNAITRQISGALPVLDLTNNASERVFGVALNYDGTLGTARGNQAYFFSIDPVRLELRLQGSQVALGGGAGAALHPLHGNAVTANGRAVHEPNTHLAFFGTGQGTIDVVDTFHFRRFGRLFIRDVISGPLRAALPFPSDNAGLQCSDKVTVTNRTGAVIGQALAIFDDADGLVPDTNNDDRCIVLKLYGVTTAGGVVVVDVRKVDILREHPARQP